MIGPELSPVSKVSAMRVYLGGDHAGYELKQAIIEHLRKTGHEPDRLRGLRL